MSLRIAFDLDGVLADMDRELVAQADALFGVKPAGQAPPASEDTRDEPEAGQSPDVTPPPLGHLSHRQIRALWRSVATVENFWERLDETEPGIVARVAERAAAGRWEVIFLTKRPETAGDLAQIQSQRWLLRRGFPMPSVYVVQGSRGRIAEALGIHVVVDDRPENCLAITAESSARPILVWRGTGDEPSTASRLGIPVVATVEEALERVATIDAELHADPSLFNRVGQMLGFKKKRSTPS